jgi:hypothetical protein
MAERAPARKWTQAEQQQLTDATRGLRGDALKAVFERLAAERGTSAWAIRSRYYELRSPRKKTGKGKAWSTRSQNQLVAEASAVSGAARTAVFEQWAHKKGLRAQTVRQKYYLLAAKAKPARAAAPVTQEPVPAPPRLAEQAPAGVEATSVPEGGGLESLSLLELARLGRRVSDEMERRVASVASLWG